METEKHFNLKKLAVCLVLFGLSLGISQYKIVQLPSGGSVTFCSTLFLYLITYIYGVPAGVLWGALLGFCKCMIAVFGMGVVPFSWNYLIFDYVLAFAVIALGGLFTGREEKRIGRLQIAYGLGIGCRFVVSSLSGMLFYYESAKSVGENLRYVLAYNGWYLLVEGVMVFLILCVPQVADAVGYLKEVFYKKQEDITLEEF